MIEAQKDLSNTVTTADALHAQERTAQSIVSRGGEFIIQVKYTASYKGGFIKFVDAY